MPEEGTDALKLLSEAIIAHGSVEDVAAESARALLPEVNIPARPPDSGNGTGA
jgi:alpha-D-ribose 1-methylphosphonate 5-triphosphate synthase subunit PhnL